MDAEKTQHFYGISRERFEALRKLPSIILHRQQPTRQTPEKNGIQRNSNALNRTDSVETVSKANGDHFQSATISPSPDSPMRPKRIAFERLLIDRVNL